MEDTTVKEYMAELGRKSAKARAGKFGKEYYRRLGLLSAAAKKAKRKGEQTPPHQSVKPLSALERLFTGKI